MKGRSKPHFDVTAGVLLKEGRVLITRRPENTHLGGFWEFPGGKREEGEDIRTCLKRELSEELGVSIRAIRRLFTVIHDYGFKAVSLHVYLCTLLDCEPQSLEGQEVRWVEPSSLKEFSFPPPDLRIVEHLSRHYPEFRG